MSPQADILAVRACKQRSGTIPSRSIPNRLIQVRVAKSYFYFVSEDSEFLVGQDSFGKQVESIDLRPS